MLGAIIGDIAGSRFEFAPHKSKAFELLHPDCRFTDDTVMTAAVGAALMEAREAGVLRVGDRAHGQDGGTSGLGDTDGAAGNGMSVPGMGDGAAGKESSQPETTESPADLGVLFVCHMQRLGRRYSHAGYGGRFRAWLKSSAPAPYYSWGNGSAMRVSPCGEIARSLGEAASLARASAAVTHDHPAGIRGAEATAVAIFLAGSGRSKEEIRDHILRYYYEIDFTLDEIRPAYSFDVSCQGSVPQALQAFFESESFEDAIRNAVSLGGDSDTMAAIAGGVAESYYGLDRALAEKAMDYLPADLQDIVLRWYGGTLPV